MNTSDLNDYQQYYLSGFKLGEFLDSESFNKLQETVGLLSSGSIKEGYRWEQKYTNTLDLRPSVHEYDSCFIDILFENNIPKLLRDMTGKDLTLAHIQLRKSGKGPSYMPWHRDLYLRDDEVIGNVPPAHKIILYISKNNDKKLSLVPGSHLCMFQNQKSNQFIMPGFSGYDSEIMKLLGVYEWESSRRGYILFNTSVLHNVIPETLEEGSLRVIYSFVEDFQFKSNFANNPVHDKINRDYMEKLENE